MKNIALILSLTLAFTYLFGQDEALPKKDSTEQMFFVGVSYGGQLPDADLKSRFGLNSSLGTQIAFKTHNNITLGVEWHFMFSKNVKESEAIFKNLYNSDFVFIDRFGQPGFVAFYQRGHSITANIGKIFPIIGPNQNSGLHVKFGAGFMWHKIKIENDFNKVPQIDGEYTKLYDRLTSGFVMSQFVGYTHFSNSRFFNFYIGLEIFEGFTKGRRDWQADLFAPYTENRFEVLYGVRAGLIVPFRRRLVADYYLF
jgi:hypothetical protein